MHFIKRVNDVVSAVGDLFFPPVCISCGTHLFKNEIEICQMCIRRLPRTHFEKRPHDNQISIMMWGRCRINQAYALFFYKKGERVQRLLHEVKYRGNIKLGEELGRQLAKTIVRNGDNSYDEIIPIPLHPKKKIKRGFNQAEVIANGMAEIMKVPVNVSDVVRNTYTSSQTRKGRFERWQNVESIFSVKSPENLAGKHLLLIDDVVTTGSTLEACVNQLSTIDNVKVSVATIACAVL
ncbi:ComF family protein [Carboxylicivirga marina]|uniref:ComF family protein n=1 Tax=Carboxylicivirga marina TaxID=2800988 RepID=UPI00259611FC|nr:phosphoribosyltransferase family protein [uncultured Carboxylicivirga sp.]